MKRVPFLDLITQHHELAAEITAVFHACLSTAAFVGGSMVEQFEGLFAETCGVRYCVGVGSGTDALRFALIAAGVEPGDIVLTVPNTFIATTEAISQVGAEPQFVDIDANTYTLNPKLLREYLDTFCEIDRGTGNLIHGPSRRRVKAVIPVHLFGQTADLDGIGEIATRYGLVMVEDACQAHGAQYFSGRKQQWVTTGSMSTAAGFSFYPGKNLGACGEAGAVTTNDAGIAKKIRMLRDHGQARKYYHEIEGYNGRLDSIQAGILSVKLKHLARWNEQRRQHAQIYNDLLAALGPEIVLPSEPSWSRGVYHLYVVRVVDRDGLRDALSKHGIETGIHYPVPLHLQNAYRKLGYKEGDFPVAEAIAKEILSLPMFPGLHRDQQFYVAEAIAEYLAIKVRAVAAAADVSVR